jgi:uncharacterized integral membrane protein
MRILTWLLRAAAFILLLSFAIKNDGLVTVYGFFASAWHVPLVVVMLGMLLAGFVLGATAVAGTVLKLRRELARASKPVSPVTSSNHLRVRPDDAIDSF